MPIVLFLGRSVKDYREKSEGIIEGQLQNGNIRCERCFEPVKRHSSYGRGIKETGEKITVTMVRCGVCNIYHALLPDFLLPGKHYSGNEIESVIIDSENVTVSEIETEASESTVRRWISGVAENIKRSVGVLKYIFLLKGMAVSEIAIQPGPPYSELEQVLDVAPKSIKSSGNKLGLANIWLGTSEIKAYI